MPAGFLRARRDGPAAQRMSQTTLVMTRTTTKKEQNKIKKKAHKKIAITVIDR